MKFTKSDYIWAAKFTVTFIAIAFIAWIVISTVEIANHDILEYPATYSSANFYEVMVKYFWKG